MILIDFALAGCCVLWKEHPLLLIGGMAAALAAAAWIGSALPLIW